MTDNKICSVDECDRPPIAKGMCHKHYYRMHRNGTLELPEKYQKQKVRKDAWTPAPCEAEEGCSLPRFTKGLCRKHYGRLQHHGHTGLITNKQPKPDVCQLEGCSASGKASNAAAGFCARHYSSFFRHGDPRACENAATARAERNAEITRRYLGGEMSMTEIARAFKLDLSAVSRIIHSKASIPTGGLLRKPSVRSKGQLNIKDHLAGLIVRMDRALLAEGVGPDYSIADVKALSAAYAITYSTEKLHDLQRRGELRMEVANDLKITQTSDAGPA